MKVSFFTVTSVLCFLLAQSCQDLFVKPSASYSVFYHANGASGAPPSDNGMYASGDRITVMGVGTLSFPGYTFGGWKLHQDGGFSDYLENSQFTMGNGNVDFYAHWQVNQNSITFEANGGQGTMYPQVLPSHSQSNLFPNQFTKEGYFFSKWNTRFDGSGISYPNNGAISIGTDDLVLFAQWSPQLNTISFYSGSYYAVGAMEPQVLATLASANLAPCTLTNPGFTFVEWNTQADGGGSRYADEAAFTMGTTNVVLYAQWSANPNVLTFDANGGTGTVNSMTLTTFSSANLPPNAFTFTGYDFDGWNTRANGSGTWYGANQSYTMGTADTTLYAQWSNYSNLGLHIDQPYQRLVTIIGADSLWVGFPSTFRVIYEGTAVAYQWYFNGVEIPDATDATLTYVQPAETAQYGANVLMLQVTDENGMTYAGVRNVVVRN